jgi:hypothetical protein
MHERVEMLRQLSPEVVVLWSVRDEDLDHGQPQRASPALKVHTYCNKEVVHISSNKPVSYPEARRAGAAWSAIGDALGITKQVAQQRFGA